MELTTIEDTASKHGLCVDIYRAAVDIGRYCHEALVHYNTEGT